jgi:DNA-binding XRE family transcriptional regulator
METLKKYSLNEMLNKHIGTHGTTERDTFETELQKDVLASIIKQARKKRNLTQSELGELVGVKKSQISKLENSLNNITIDTLLKVFNALNVNINFTAQIA